MNIYIYEVKMSWLSECWLLNARMSKFEYDKLILAMSMNSLAIDV